MKKKTYAIFTLRDSISFYICPLENLPLHQRELFQNYVDQQTINNHQRYFAESMQLEWMNNELYQKNFFETYHDGNTFAFRGNGAIFCALAQLENKNLFSAFIRVSLEKTVSISNIINAFVGQDLIEI